MSQEEFERKLLEFLRNCGGLVLYEEIAQWKLSHPEYRGCSVEKAVKSLEKKGLVECTERGVRAL